MGILDEALGALPSGLTPVRDITIRGTDKCSGLTDAPVRGEVGTNMRLLAQSGSLAQATGAPAATMTHLSARGNAILQALTRLTSTCAP